MSEKIISVGLLKGLLRLCANSDDRDLAYRGTALLDRTDWDGLISLVGDDSIYGDNVLRIIERVSVISGVSEKKIFAGGRKPKVVMARHFAMYVLRVEHGCTFSEVARALGREYSTIRHGCRRISMAIEGGDERVRDLQKKYGSGPDFQLTVDGIKPDGRQ